MSITSLQTLCAVHIMHILHQCLHSYQLRSFILLNDHILDLIGELTGDLILQLVHLPVRPSSGVSLVSEGVWHCKDAV